MTILRVGVFQFAPVFGKVSHNLDKVVKTLDRADPDLIVLSELCASGYQFASQQEAITLSELVPNRPTTQRLIDLASMAAQCRPSESCKRIFPGINTNLAPWDRSPTVLGL